MHKKTPQDYAKELIKMYRETLAATDTIVSEAGADQSAAQPQSSQVEFGDESGGIQVNVTTLRQLFPVKGATVTVFRGEGGQKEILQTDITDESGKSRVFKLETPAKGDSQQAENNGILPYASYNVSVRSDGYVEQIAMNVPVFSGVVSVQGIDLVPVAAAGGNTNPQIIEGGNDYNL